jgi:hypothetical protein
VVRRTLTDTKIWKNERWIISKVKRLDREQARRGKTPQARREAKQRCAMDLARIRRAHEAGNELAVYDALLLCKEIGWAMPPWVPVPLWVVDALIAEGARVASGEKPSKRRGCHASPINRQEQLRLDALWFNYVRKFREKGLSKTSAFNKLANKVHCTPDAIRKAYERHKNRRRRKSYYFSSLIDRKQTWK